jgi:hypothetical protein
VFEISTSKYKKFTQLLYSNMYNPMMATIKGRNM